MKIFQTQLQGLLQRFQDYELDMEEAARLVSQAIISEGQLYIYGEKELRGIVQQALLGEDALPSIVESTAETRFSELDVVLVFSPDPGSETAAAIVKKAAENGAQVIGISSPGITEKADEAYQTTWTTDCQYHFSTGISKGFVPLDDGRRIGKPHLLAALHLFYQLYFIVLEFLEEYEM
ncbi:protein of unknown function [Evansella caseinilytica]|uniref:DUF2529 domain-containing protein n=1 Tax=Evansella caseinilytica TaxID=1503961 RepID=A0A1H3T502_9BACI|nr:DUF2529 family protein [Evansella caseinilytica]SDZ44968.1 protein of unknown function [Evansella caseinilytica]